MRIIDGFLFNGEFEILKLRLELMGPFVDEFLIIESSRTFSGITKQVLLQDRLHEYEKHLPKIRYCLVSEIPEPEGAWTVEHYLRDQIRVLSNANDNDLMIISDVDEILNLNVLLNKVSRDIAQLIELPCYYYFLNLKSSESIFVTMITPYSLIKEFNIGNRHDYKKISSKTIYSEKGYPNGGHFTYQFGYNIDKYILKIRSFSHQEFNNPYYLDRERLKTYLKHSLDIFDRWEYQYKNVDPGKELLYMKDIIMHDEAFIKLVKRDNAFSLTRKYFYLLTNRKYVRYLYWKSRVYLSAVKKKLLQTRSIK